MSALSKEGFDSVIQGKVSAEKQKELSNLFGVSSLDADLESFTAANRRYPLRRDRDHHHVPDLVHDAISKRKQKKRGKRKNDTLIKRLRISKEELDAHRQFEAADSFQTSLLSQNVPFRVRTELESGFREQTKNRNMFLLPVENYSIQARR
jgi:hypothetical protein